MATVYLAHDLRHDRPVALKVLHPDLASTLGPDRFQREIRLAARLQHPHILGVHDSGETGGFLWFTMPYVEGESLRSRLTRERQLPLEEAVRISREAADALEYAHQHGIVHRDIKPENILLSSGHALVADFGIARALSEDSAGLTGTGMIVGTPAYMSPEQASGERQLDGRTDVYALGCVLYEMLAGEPPFTGPTAQAIISRALTDSPRPLHGVRQTIPSALDLVVAKAMARIPADRYSSTAEFARALTAATETHVTTAPGGDAPAATGSRRRSMTLATVFGIGLLLGSGALFAWRFSTDRKGGDDSGSKLVAVLPFENQGAPEDEYFADGLTDEIRGKLSQVSGLDVIASGSANQYKKSDKSPRQIANELGVRYLLTGKVRWEKGAAGNRVRVSPELIVISGNQPPTTLWQAPFDASLTGVFQVQADIAAQVAQALDVALGSAERQQLGERPTENLAAYDAYLKGEEIRNLGNPSPAALRPASQYYEQAVALDSNFAVAWARFALVQTMMYVNGMPDPQLMLSARHSAERAVRLAPDRPEPAIALATHRRYNQRTEEAREILATALRSWPDNPELLASQAVLESALGRWEEALALHDRALKLDPRSADNLRRRARALTYLRRYDEGLSAADLALTIVPTNLAVHQTRVVTFLARGDLDGARRMVAAFPPAIDPTTRVAYMGTYWDLFWVLTEADQQLLLRLTPTSFDGNRLQWAIVLAQTWWQRGDRNRARAYADTARIANEQQLALAPDDAQTHAFLGLSNAYMGRKAEAVAAGERAVRLVPVERDGYVGPYYVHLLARTYTLAGEYDKAVTTLEQLLSKPYFVSRAWLRIDPNFEPLRSHPGFQRLIAQ